MNWPSLLPFFLVLSPVIAAPPVPVRVAMQADATGPLIPSDFSGLSFETQLVLADAQGHHFFSPDNKRLISLFRTLGIKSLRIGGNTTDNPAIAVPRSPDLDQLFAFARAVPAKVIFTLRLRQGDPTAAATTAKYVMDRYAADMTCFAIGNEPNIYAKTYREYVASLKTYLSAITGEGVAPTATICGPSTTPSHADWARQLAGDFGGDRRLRFISQHEYPGNSGSKVTDPVGARAAMLSPAWVEEYGKIQQSFAPEAAAHGFPFRLEETNNFYNGGAKGVSDTFAATLWALDYLHWWAAHDAAGLNFHTGDYVAKADETTRCWYASFWTKPGGGYEVRPIGYALKAFEMGSMGRHLPAPTLENPGRLNLTTYGVRLDDGSLVVTLINKECGQDGRGAMVILEAGPRFGHALYVELAAPNNDIAATDGITLGGGAIAEDGWIGHWSRLERDLTTHRLQLELPAGSAAVVHLVPN